MSSTNCSGELPTAKEMIQVMTSSFSTKSVLIVTTILTGITLVLFAEIVVSAARRVPYGARRGYTIFLLGHFPVFSITSLASIYIPRAGIIASWAASLYLSLGLYVFILLIMAHFRGIDTMVRRLKDVQISLAQAPIACCCPCCCPKIKLTHRNIHRLRLVVLQGAVIQPLTLFLASILWTDGIYIPAYISKSSSFLYLTVISLISTLLGVYGLTVFYRMSAVPLKKYWVREKFMALKIVMILPNIQTLVIAILVRLRVISCQPPLSAAMWSNVIYNALVICEMFVLIFASRFVLYKLHQRNRRRRMSSLVDAEAQVNNVQAQSNDVQSYLLLKASRNSCGDANLEPQPEGSRIIRHIETDV